MATIYFSKDLEEKHVPCPTDSMRKAHCSMKGNSQYGSDFELIEAIGNGNHKAFEALVKRYQTPLFNFAYRYLADGSVAEEVTQEVFLRIYRAASEFRVKKHARASTWIFKIAYNLSMNQLKRRNRYLRWKRWYVTSLLPETQIPASMEDRIFLKQILSELSKLPEKQRAALLLRVDEGLSYKEISEVLQVSTSSVEALLFRARKKLKQRINKE